MQLSDLKQRIAESTRIVGFTGAGISTESGISDYRGSGGVWTRYRVVTIQEFLAIQQRPQRILAKKGRFVAFNSGRGAQ